MADRITFSDITRKAKAIEDNYRLWGFTDYRLVVNYWGGWYKVYLYKGDTLLSMVSHGKAKDVYSQLFSYHDGLYHGFNTGKYGRLTAVEY